MRGASSANEEFRTQLLAGKHALVTGGSRGIGAAVARLLRAHGASLTITGRDEKRLKQAARDLGAGYVLAEVSQREHAAKAVETAGRETGRVDILVNNAGEAVSAPFLKTGGELWRKMLDVNLDGTFFFMQAALPAMLDAGWGRVVNIASTAGLTGYAYVSAYCAAKHAVVGLTRSVAIEVATQGVTVNAVCPGYTDTEMVQGSVEKIMSKTGKSQEAVIAELLSRNPQKRLVRPEEAANAVAWLCLPGSEAMNGQCIAVAGGEIM